MTTMTLIDGERALEVEATVDENGARLSPEALGWSLEPRGLCRGETCIPVRDRDALVRDGEVDLAELARLLDRPLAIDLEERVAALAASATERSQRLASLEAPDFTLPDLQGRTHSLSEHRGKKVLLIAYASW